MQIEVQTRNAKSDLDDRRPRAELRQQHRRDARQSQSSNQESERAHEEKHLFELLVQG